MASSKKTPIRSTRTSAKKPVKRAAGRSTKKQKQVIGAENRVFWLTLSFTILSLVFLASAMLRYAH